MMPSNIGPSGNLLISSFIMKTHDAARAPVKRGYQDTIFLISPLKYMLRVFIRSAFARRF